MSYAYQSMASFRNLHRNVIAMDLTSLKAYWALDETSGNALDTCDESSSSDCVTAMDLTVTGATHDAGDVCAGQEAYDFDGVNDELTGTANNMADALTGNSASTNFSVNFWISADSPATDISGILKSLGATNGLTGDFMMDYNHQATTLRFYLWENNGADADGRHNWTDFSLGGAGWKMCTVTHTSAGVWEAFLDASSHGAADNTATTADAWEAEDRIGTVYSPGTSFFMEGLLSNISLWRRVLTQDDITTLYNTGCPLDIREQ